MGRGTAGLIVCLDSFTVIVAESVDIELCQCSQWGQQECCRRKLLEVFSSEEEREEMCGVPSFIVDNHFKLTEKLPTSILITDRPLSQAND